MKVIVGCEYSGRVRQAFRERGHDAWSCDLLPAEDASPFHYQGDVFEAIAAQQWDLGIFHPPCTFLNLAGIQWLYHPEDTHLAEHLRRRHPKFPNRMCDFENAVKFFNDIREAALVIPKVCIENSQPHGLAKSKIGEYTQKVQPWMFGDPNMKGACLWLKNLPPLVETDVIPKELRVANCHKASPGPKRWIERSRTHFGIANAMAQQWG